MATSEVASHPKTEIPSHYKAIVYDKPGEISTKIETLETPKPGVGEVLINLVGCYNSLKNAVTGPNEVFSY